MSEFAIFWEWFAFAVRFLHVITAIAWIGSSFYFIALDLGLIHRDHLPKGAKGEEWQVHGGGFYHIQKYMVAPDSMPKHLIWFKWESYATWLSGFAMLAVVYYAGADLYLIDRNVLDIAVWQGIALSVASIGLGWVLYDYLCKSPLGKSTTGLMVILFGILVVMAWGYTQIFSGRAAMLHMGAFTATIMTANVFFLIIPNQKIVVADLLAGRDPDPKYGVMAKQRSLHNNYLTLPVIFFMLTPHYPLAFATDYNWIIAGLIFLIGVVIRHYFNTKHARKGKPNWTWLTAIILFFVIVWLSGNPGQKQDEVRQISASAQVFMDAAQFRDVSNIVQGSCSMCHGVEPFWPGVNQAPKGVLLDNDANIAKYAQQIYLQSGITNAMPPGNVVEMSNEDRSLIVEWYRGVLADTGRLF
ncbi:MAG: urate hydroxylase PuuD [Devosiaceae bacterium]|nr:urate hydroxylase PuuD [Devosiaceae bacterium]